MELSGKVIIFKSEKEARFGFKLIDNAKTKIKNELLSLEKEVERIKHTNACKQG